MLRSKGFTVSALLSTVGLIVFGTTVSTLHKAAYDLEVIGVSGIPQHFEKPWAMMLVMFLGMALCLPSALKDELEKQNSKTGGRELTLWQVLSSPAEVHTFALVSIPATFDIAATLLMNIGLLSVTASVYQMLRGAGVLFAALFTVTFLKRDLNRLHYMGILFAVAGVGVVGAASLLSGEGSAGHDITQAEMLTGIGLIVLGQCVQAAQFIFEDYVMSERGVPALKVIAYEGVMGSVATAVAFGTMTSFVSPDVALKGLYENSADTIAMVQNSPVIASLLAINVVAFCGLNISGMKVTEELGGSFRTVLETLRTLFIWLVGLALFYNPFGTTGSLGESWHDFTYLQLGGFGVMAVGTLVYARGTKRQKEFALAAATAQLESSLLLDSQESTIPQGAAAIANGPVNGADQNALPARRQLAAPVARQQLTAAASPLALLPTAVTASSLAPPDTTNPGTATTPARRDTSPARDDPWDRFPPTPDMDDLTPELQPLWEQQKQVPVFISANGNTPLEPYMGRQNSNAPSWPTAPARNENNLSSPVVPRSSSSSNSGNRLNGGLQPSSKQGRPMRREGVPRSACSLPRRITADHSRSASVASKMAWGWA